MQFPEHAMRVLYNVAKYDINKRLQVNFAVVNAIERWLGESNVHEHIHSPLEILEPMLKKEEESSRLRGHEVVMMAFPVNYEKTKILREKVLSILLECTKSPLIHVVLRSLKMLINSLSPPRSLFGRSISDEEIGQWLSEEISILDIIEKFMKQCDDPIVLQQVALDLQRHARLSHQQIISERSKNIIKNIPDSFNLRTIKAIWKPFDMDFTSEDFDQYQERITEEINKAVKEFPTYFDDSKKVFDFLNEILNTFQKCAIQVQPYDFLYLLSLADSELSIQIVKHIISNPHSPLTNYISPLLSGIREKSPNIFIGLIELIMKLDDDTVFSSIAYYYARHGGSLSITNREIDIVIKKLLKYENKYVKNLATEALGRFPVEKRDKAIKLALSVNIKDDKNLANTLCGVFSKYRIPPNNLKTEELIAILSKIIYVAELDHLSDLNNFIGYCCSKIPEQIVDFFFKRFDIAEEKIKTPGENYIPIPAGGFHGALKNISASEIYKDILRKVRDNTLTKKSAYRLWLPILYAEISDGFCSSSLEVLSEWINSDEEKIQAVGLLIKNSPPDFVFSNLEFVSNLLEESFRISTDCYNRILEILSSSASSGIRTGLPGQPMQQDVKLFEQAKEISRKFPKGSSTQQFYFILARNAEKRIHHKLMIDEELFEAY